MIRLFAALEVPDDIAEALGTCQRGLKGARWRPREALHLTLRFFGEISERRAEDLDDALGAVRQRAFELCLARTGAAVGADGRGAVYAGVEENEALRRLQAKCEGAALKTGLAAEARGFRPHVTLAYLSGGPGPETATWIQTTNLLRTPHWRVERFLLYSSRLGRSGARYEIEREHPLS